MPDREIIHASSDVSSFLKRARELGLLIRLDAPTAAPQSQIIPAVVTINSFERGAFSLFRPEWIFGPQQFHLIEAGHNAGSYTQSPSVNSTQISAFFAGERSDGETLRLGSGVISWNKKWLDADSYVERPSPPDVKQAYDDLIASFDTKRTLAGGVHRYLVMPGALEKLTLGAASPPFDYIEWPLTD